MSINKKNIAIVCQRFGKMINGGAEAHAYQLALQLSKLYNVTILTSCAVDHHTWNPELSPGVYKEEGLTIIRFSNDRRASKSSLRFIRRKITGRLLSQKVYSGLGKPKILKQILNAEVTEADQMEWLIRQGPYMPELQHHLLENKYDAVIAITMLYYPSAISAMTVPNKTILVPTLHDEKASYYPVYKKVMEQAEWLLFNTAAEERLAHRLFHLTKKIATAGVGIELVKDKIAADPSVLNQFNITSKYIICVGRIDKNKGSHLLVDWFARYLEETKKNCTLVMAGKSHTKMPAHSSIIYTGFIADEMKTQLMLQAEALVIPSFYESLSLVLLESMACGVPVIANAKAEVLKDHIEKSGGGWAFYSYEDLKHALDELFTNATQKKRKVELGFEYVKDHYSWQKILEIYTTAIEDVSKSK